MAIVAENVTAGKRKGSRTGVRILYFLGTWLVAAAILLQVVLIGFYLFDTKPAYLGAHEGIGFLTSHALAPIVLIIGFFARLGRNLVIVNAATLVLAFVTPVFAGLAATSPKAAAFHPLSAVLLFACMFYLMLRVRGLLPAPWGTATKAPAAPARPPQAPAKPVVRVTPPAQR